MQENYGTDLQTSHIGDGQHGADGRYTGGDARMQAHPLEFEPVINCPWGESNYEFGPYSPATLKATSWVRLNLRFKSNYADERSLTTTLLDTGMSMYSRLSISIGCAQQLRTLCRWEQWSAVRHPTSSSNGTATCRTTYLIGS